jgi:HK97 family phage portal protein
VNLRGDSIGALRWIVTDKDDNELPNHPAQALLNRPNTQQSQSTFFGDLSRFRDLGGDGYILANMVGGKPKELTLIRPDNVTIMPGNGMPAAYQVSTGGAQETYKVNAVTGQSAIFNWKLFNPLSDLYGLSPLSASGKPVDVFNEAEEHAKKTLQQGANMGGVLSTEQKLDPEQFERLQNAIQSKYSGGANAGKMMITEGGMKFTQTASTLKDMTMIDLQTEQSRYISQSFGVPDQMIGIPGSNTFANFSEARIYYIENTVVPMAEDLQESLTYWLAPMYGEEIKIKYDIASIQGLEERRSQIYARIQNVTFMTINEKREQAGLPPIDGGDVLAGINTEQPTTEEPAGSPVDNGVQE